VEGEVRRIDLLRRWVRKDHHVLLMLLVEEEHTLAKAVRCATEAGLCLHILRPTHFELLVCVGVSSPGVNLSRALGVTTTLPTARSSSLPRTLTHDAHKLRSSCLPGARVKKTASMRSMGQPETHLIFFFSPGRGGNPMACSLASLSTSKVCTSSQRLQRQ
jgi:hypothetical protein